MFYICMILCVFGAGIFAYIAVATTDDDRVVATEVNATDFPNDAAWERVISLPTKIVWDNLAMNYSASFRGYAGQGIAYLSIDEAVQGFRLFINNIEINTRNIASGNTYCLDLSGVSVNGDNSVVISDVRPSGLSDAIVLYFPYPEVIVADSEDLLALGLNSLSFQVIDHLLAEETTRGFPSAQLAVIKDGRLVYQNAWGVTNTNGAHNRVDNSTLYDIGGLTGCIGTTFAIQYLVDAGKLDLDAKVVSVMGEEFASRVIPSDIGNLDEQRAWKRSLTIRQLLAHQSGFPTGIKFYLKSDDIWDQICQAPLICKPGTMGNVSDIDMIILGLIVEKITGTDLSNFCTQAFWEPMGISTCYQPLKHGFTIEQICATELTGNTRGDSIDFPYVRTDTVWGEVHDETAYYCLNGIAGHAGIFSNATDLAKLGYCMLTGGYGSNKFFTRATIEHFTAASSASDGRFGLGWRRQGDNASYAYYFGTDAPSTAFGGIAWNGPLLLIDPVHQLVIAYCTNAINTPLVDATKDANIFQGNHYLADSRGFIPQLIYQGMNCRAVGDFEVVFASLIPDMISAKQQLIANEFVPTFGREPTASDGVSRCLEALEVVEDWLFGTVRVY